MCPSLGLFAANPQICEQLMGSDPSYATSVVCVGESEGSLSLEFLEIETRWWEETKRASILSASAKSVSACHQYSMAVNWLSTYLVAWDNDGRFYNDGIWSDLKAI